MDMIKYFGKMLLLVIVPVGFIVVSTISVSALIAVVSFQADNMTFEVAFKSILPLISLLMTLIAFVGVIWFFSNLKD